jgi:UDP-N-acetylglucosamine 1-carboxyvinyltransferase
MTHYQITGGNKLKGEIAVKGAKNHALKMLPAALLCDTPSTFTNVPNILDIRIMKDIIENLGGSVTYTDETCTIDPSGITTSDLPSDLVTQIRASFLFIIPLLHTFKKVVFPHPGGDAIGRRPIDMTLDFLRHMGATVEEKQDSYVISAKKLTGIDFTFKWVTHTGTEALILAAVKAQGTTRIYNAALEPEVGALCEYLNACGAKISGIDTTTLTIEGVERLTGCEARIIPDRIEAGTFALLGALLGNPLTITQCEPQHLLTLWKYFELMGIKHTLTDTSVTVYQSSIKPEHVKTHEYPGFPTDLQPPMTLALTQAHGQSMMHETIYDGRLFFVDTLGKMGAQSIMADPHRVIINGPSQLYAKDIASPDVRAGITFIMAALLAQGTSTISKVHHIQRGHADIVKRLQAIGADITEITN